MGNPKPREFTAPMPTLMGHWETNEPGVQPMAPGHCNVCNTRRYELVYIIEMGSTTVRFCPDCLTTLGMITSMGLRSYTATPVYREFRYLEYASFFGFPIKKETWATLREKCDLVMTKKQADELYQNAHARGYVTPERKLSPDGYAALRTLKAITGIRT